MVQLLKVFFTTIIHRGISTISTPHLPTIDAELCCANNYRASIPNHPHLHNASLCKCISHVRDTYECMREGPVPRRSRLATHLIISSSFRITPIGGHLFNSFIRRLNHYICANVCRPSRPATSRRNFHGSIVSLIGRLNTAAVHCPNNGFISNCH